MGMVVESRAGFVFLPYVYYECGIAIGVVVWKIRSCIRNLIFLSFDGFFGIHHSVLYWHPRVTPRVSVLTVVRLEFIANSRRATMKQSVSYLL